MSTNLFSFIKSQLSILDVVSEYATLKKAGLYWKGHCPFHNEKTASFTVSPHKEIFYCFGCHIGGDLIAFIAKIENCSQLEAAKQLIERYQLTVPDTVNLETAQPSQENKNYYFKLCKLLSVWCHENLKKNPSLITYFQQRGINQKSIDHFMLGYFPGGLAAVKNLIRFMGTHNILPHDLLEANILSEGKNVLYSGFEERLIFPIKDHLGRFCGFGGRIFKPNDERPKYYNSRENSYFVKGTLLFGLDLAKKHIQEKEMVFLVEGYTDCIAMAQHGFANTVATLGTACTLEHLKQLSNYAQQLYVVYDGDAAGQKAILRLTELCWHVSLELKAICLPAQEDPASFLAKGNSLDPFIKDARDIFDFFIDSLGQNFTNKPLHEKLALVRKIVETIYKLDDRLKQDILLQKVSKTFDVPFEALKGEFRRVDTKTQARHTALPQQPQAQNTPEPPQESQEQPLEKKIFCAIINNLQLFNKTNEKYLIEHFPSALRIMLKRLKEIRDGKGSLDFIEFFDSLNEGEKQYVSKLLLEFEEEIQSNTFEQLMLQLRKKNWKIIVHDIKTRLAQAKHEGNTQEAEKILLEFLELKQAMVEKIYK